MRLHTLLFSAIFPSLLFVSSAPVTADNDLIIRDKVNRPAIAQPKAVNAQIPFVKQQGGGTTSKTGNSGKKIACPAKARTIGTTKKLGKRAPIVIGFMGTGSDAAKELMQTKMKADNKNGARLGPGLYMTDKWKLAEQFAWLRARSDRTKRTRPYLCRISIDDATWATTGKIWIPKEMIALTDEDAAEAKRRAYETEHCVESPSVRFSPYATRGSVPDSHEMVIPAALQRGLIVECKDIGSLTPNDDSENEEPPFPPMAASYKDLTVPWGIVGE